ncbi:aldehyde dehydrogenase (NADP(+)) [Armatimonas rosea]|uniref:NADP-dependent aldehyde dehydrogenase n=1 Tax=Armatimonas rosea TaxID=685828 RepID=A0A7W9SXK6_ARMRO|nr:aldehyde dehydrogenase (NADP(+)) [Armatimonas rosea]MBB6053773.1 NADP-dependent aldehyde dehydrogenase [Armatimonas rosea]
MSTLHPVLIAGQWRAADAPSATFSATNPTTGQLLADDVYPVSSKADVDAVLVAAAQAAPALRATSPETIAAFLNRYADLLEANRDALVAAAHAETGFPTEPRLNSVELPRTTGQLRQAAQAALTRSWTRPVIDTKTGIRSLHEPLGGAALVFGPNNFPFAFNAIAGGDFAAAIAARCPVIAKVHTSHPTTSRLMAECAHQAATEIGLPVGSIQVLYRMDHKLSLGMIENPAVAAVGFTGSRSAGMQLKEVADRHGKPVYLEMSSVNPVFILPDYLAANSEALAAEFFTSCTMGAGQFCTNPGLLVLPGGELGAAFVAAAAAKFAEAKPGVLLNKGGRDSLAEAVETLKSAGATVVCGGEVFDDPGFRYANTILTVTGAQFIADPETLQTEAFGPASLLVLCESGDEMLAVANALEGNLTGTVYANDEGADDAFYTKLAPALRVKVGRLLNNKMPTGVAVSPAMNHGGPFPATGHPFFSSVGIPHAISRFSMLCSYDNVRPHRLPAELQDGNPLGIWRLVDGDWVK